jgi:hypothetical protein
MIMYVCISISVVAAILPESLSHLVTAGFGFGDGRDQQLDGSTMAADHFPFTRLPSGKLT